MKKQLFLITLLIYSFMGFAQNWKSDSDHSRLSFITTHMLISDVSGVFKSFEASIQASKEDFSDAVFELVVDVKSINTEIEKRDNHLRSADFFDVEKYPTLSFKSTKLEKAGENTYKMSGNLTMHGITYPVTLTLQYRGSIENPNTKKTTAGFQVMGKVKRSDFNIGPKFSNNIISDEVMIKAGGEFQKQ